jgi:molybdate transport system substrate-binding protein
VFYRGHLGIVVAAVLAIVVGIVGAVVYRVAQSGSDKPVVYAASSLKVLTRISSAGGTTYQFASSQTLERQIIAGAPADVFVSASPRYAGVLYRAGRCTKPVAFASNTVVLVTPRSNPAHIGSMQDLAARAGIVVAIAGPGVPVGDAARLLLKNLGISDILSRDTVTSVTDDAAAVSQVKLGVAQAGFVFATDWHSAPTALTEIVPPAGAQPPVTYEVCAVRRSGARSDAAAAFIHRLTSPQGQALLTNAGFGPPRSG